MAALTSRSRRLRSRVRIAAALAVLVATAAVVGAAPFLDGLAAISPGAILAAVAVAAAAFALAGPGAGAGVAVSTAFGVLTVLAVAPGAVALLADRFRSSHRRGIIRGGDPYAKP